MTKMARTMLLLCAMAASAGCSQTARNEASETSEAISADINATTAEAIADTTNAMDAAGGVLGSSAAAVGNATENVSEAVGSALDNGADAVDNSM